MKIHYSDGTITCGTQTILSDLPSTAAVHADRKQIGLFLSSRAEKPAAEHRFVIGRMPELVRFMACHRVGAPWMVMSAGSQTSAVPMETQFLLAQVGKKLYIVLVPLLDGSFRCSLQGAEDQTLELIAESGDAATTTDAVTGLFVAAGTDPYALAETAAHAVMDHMQTGRLRKDKPLPEFMDDFGWCTFDAFYADVIHDGILQGLESFRAGGITPRVLLIDGGWQAMDATLIRGARMASFAADVSKFPGGLAETIRMCKVELGVRRVIMWHAASGLIGGLSPQCFPQYQVRMVERRPSPGVVRANPPYAGRWWGPAVGMIDPVDVHRFYQDFYRSLRQAGADGVKVDFQMTLEEIAHDTTDRVSLNRLYHEAMEGAAHTHFGGAMINCMSCGNDSLYATLASTVTRTSDDYSPKRPANHTRHLVTNAYVSFWFGHFVHPDWDMFQSHHPLGAYHAAGRAISGGPIMVSDEVGKQDFSLLRKLVFADGTVPRPRSVAMPTPDCLLHNPYVEDVPLKVFNRNVDAAVVGVFNARYEKEADVPAVSGTISPSDVPGLAEAAANRFAVYAHYGQMLRAMTLEEKLAFTLPRETGEVYTIVPVYDAAAGVGPIGLVDMFNASGAIVSKGLAADGTYEIELRGTGRFVAWSKRKPLWMECAGKQLVFKFDAKTHRLECMVEKSPARLRIGFGDGKG